METFSIKRVIACIVIMFVFSVHSFGADVNNFSQLIVKYKGASKDEKRKIIRVFASKKIDKKQIAESDLIYLIGEFDKESRLKPAFVALKRKEGLSLSQALSAADRKYRTNEYKSYFLSFARLISNFQDKRAVPALLRSISEYGPEISPSNITMIGDVAIGALLESAKSNEAEVKRTAYYVLGVWVKGPFSSEDYKISKAMGIKHKQQIRKMFIEALNDEDIDVRSIAVSGLESFPDDEVVKKLEKVAEEDPYSYYSKRKNINKYPIRKDAQNILERIKMKEN